MRLGINFDIKNSDKLIEKIPFKGILAVITMISAFSLLSPDWLLEKLFLLEIRNQISTYLGIALVVCFAIWVTLLLTNVVRAISKKIAFNEKNSKKRFQRISPVALITVLAMYQSPTHSMRLNIEEATTIVLENYLFIHRGTLSSHGLDFDYTLQPWVIKYLSKHFSEYKHILTQSQEY